MGVEGSTQGTVSRQRALPARLLRVPGPGAGAGRRLPASAVHACSGMQSTFITGAAGTHRDEAQAVGGRRHGGGGGAAHHLEHGAAHELGQQLLAQAVAPAWRTGVGHAASHVPPGSCGLGSCWDARGGSCMQGTARSSHWKLKPILLLGVDAKADAPAVPPWRGSGVAATVPGRLHQAAHPSARTTTVARRDATMRVTGLGQARC